MQPRGPRRLQAGDAYFLVGGGQGTFFCGPTPSFSEGFSRRGTSREDSWDIWKAPIRTGSRVLRRSRLFLEGGGEVPGSCGDARVQLQTARGDRRGPVCRHPRHITAPVLGELGSLHFAAPILLTWTEKRLFAPEEPICKDALGSASMTMACIGEGYPLAVSWSCRVGTVAAVTASRRGRNTPNIPHKQPGTTNYHGWNSRRRPSTIPHIQIQIWSN